MDTDDPKDNISYVFILLFSLFFMVLYFVYIFIVLRYILQNYSKKKISIHWIQYLITCVTSVLFLFIYLCYLMKFKGDKSLLFNGESFFIIIITIFLISITFIIINNLIYDSIASIILSFNLNRMIKIKSLDFQELFLTLKNIRTYIFNTKQYIIYWGVFGIVNICLTIIFECEYTNYDDENTPKIFKVKTFIIFLKNIHIISFTILIITIFVMNYFRKKFFIKNYYNTNLFGMKIYNIKSCQIIYNSDITIIKTICDILINIPVSIFLIFKICNSFFMIITEVLLFLYILILGALYFNIDKNNDVGKISKTIKFWFKLKSINFYFRLNEHKNYINENTYKYSKEEKKLLKDLKLDEIEGINDNNKIDEESKNLIKSEDTELDIKEENNNDKIKKLKFKNKILNFETNSELYVLYKLLMLYFEKNENIYLGVQRNINEDGTPFKRFFTEQNLSKNRKTKARQTFGVNEVQERKSKFLNNIDRISRISRLNSSNITPSMKFKESKIFFSLEEKELKEEFKKKFDFPEKKTTFKIESLSSLSFFELFPFYQISIQDIIKSLNPSDNKKIYNIIRERNKKNIEKNNENKNNIESESENNLFYTYNSLLMMEVYEREEFISSDELNKFTISYGTYLLDIIKNIKYTFIPLILGVFNIEICGENKIVILYRNPLFFSNFCHFNHWINFFITEGPEKLKVSILQKDIIDLNEIEIKNSLKMNEADYEEIINNLKNDFNFFMKMNIQVYPIIHLFIGDENNSGWNNNDANESSLMDDLSFQQNNLSGLLNNLDEGGFNFNNNKNNEIKEDDLYGTETNSLVDKEYYSSTKNNIHTLKIYFTHFFRLDCELNKQNDKDDDMKLKSNPYCQYLEGQLQTYLTKTTLFELDDN